MTTLHETASSGRTASPARTVRDIRVDHVGFIGELDKQFATPLRAKIKDGLGAKEADVAAADFFTGSIVGRDALTTTVDPAKFFRLYKNGKLTEGEFLSAITVGVTAAKRLMSQEALLHISDQAPASPRLCIVRNKDAQVSIAQAIAAVAAAIGT